MRIAKEEIEQQNQKFLKAHDQDLQFLINQLAGKGINGEGIIAELMDFQVAIPSWALGAGGTRFGRFVMEGVPGTLEEKLDDIGLLHALNQSSGAISLHIPWDIPKDYEAIKEQAESLDIVFDAMNSNTFQDQPGQKYSYKFGSLCHVKPEVRQQAIDHNIEVIKHGVELGSKAITVWLADGSNFPGQLDFRTAHQNTLYSLEEIYREMPDDWKMLVEYKPYEPNFYSTVIQDWGTSFLLASKLGPNAFTLVDLGHHLPNTNIEQIVATLLLEGKLGGFHFNDSKYGDDDLTVGAIKPYQLFLIFTEIIKAKRDAKVTNPPISWMIDASHNVKDPLEDLLQSVDAILVSLARTLLVDHEALQQLQQENDVVYAQELLQDAFRMDVRPLVREASRRRGGALFPIQTFRDMKVRDNLMKARKGNAAATGL